MIRRTDLDILAAGDLGKMFLRLEGLVRTVVGRRRADDAEASLDRVTPLGEHEELAEERHNDDEQLEEELAARGTCRRTAQRPAHDTARSPCVILP